MSKEAKEYKLKSIDVLKEFRVVLNSIQYLIDAGENQINTTELKGLWNDLSNAITSHESKIEQDDVKYKKSVCKIIILDAEIETLKQENNVLRLMHKAEITAKNKEDE